MPLMTEFKEALNNAINDFSQKEGKLTEIQAQVVIELKNIIKSIDSGVHLRQEVALKLRKIPSKTFAFLPFVNDLPKEIRSVLEDKQFSEYQLLIAGYGDLYSENKRLHMENAVLRKEFDEFKTSGLEKEIARTLQNLKQENIRLGKELDQRDVQHQQAIELIEAEKQLLEDSVTTLARKKESLENELEQVKAKKQQLAEDNLQLADENTQLKEENRKLKALKAELEAYQQAKGQDGANQNNNTHYRTFRF